MTKSTTAVEPRFAVSQELPKALDVLGVGLYEKTTAVPKPLAWVDAELDGALGRLIALGDFKGKTGAAMTVPGTGGIKRIVLLGLGKEAAPAAAGLDAVRWAASSAVKAVRAGKGQALAMVLPFAATGELGQAIAEGAIMGPFAYQEFKPGKPEDQRRLTLTLIDKDAGERKNIVGGLERGAIIGAAANLTRQIACRPGNVINPTTLCAEARKIASANALKIKIIDAAQARRLGMGGLIGVGQGSTTPPALIVMEYVPAKKAKTYAVVGKAITFDTGGISIKPAGDMDSMKYDKAGGMAVLGVMQAVAQLKLPLHVVGVIPTAENAVGSGAYRPGDILRLYNKKTVEITNTDAEGRLILADAVAYTAEKFKPEVMIDMATLTGGCVVALGHFYAGMFATDDALAEALFEAGQKSGEWVWRLPLHEKYRSMMDGHHADLINAAGREASPITGASFIQHCVPEGQKWAHLDIAGTAMPKRDDRYLTKGATGFGVRVVVEYLRNV